MTATTATSPTPAARVAPRGTTGTGLGFGRILRSEWLKFASVRSTWITLIITAGVMVGIPVLAALYFATKPEAQRPAVAPDGIAFQGLTFGLLVVGVLGAMVMSTEYGTGAIRASVTAVPRRGVLLTAKALMLTVVMAVTMTVTVFAAWAASAVVLSMGHIEVSLTAHHGLARTGLAIASLVLTALFALGVAALLRSTAGSVSVVMAILFVLPIVFSLLPGEWAQHVLYVLPQLLADSMTGWAHASSHIPGRLGWQAATAVYAAWAFVPLAAGYVAFRRRDV